MSIQSKSQPPSKLLVIMLTLRGVVVRDFVAITLSLIGMGALLAAAITGNASGPLVHSWSVWGFGL